MVRIFLDERFSGSGANDIYVPYLSLPGGRTGNRSGRGSGRWSVPTRSSCRCFRHQVVLRRHWQSLILDNEQDAEVNEYRRDLLRWLSLPNNSSLPPAGRLRPISGRGEGI